MASTFSLKLLEKALLLFGNPECETGMISRAKATKVVEMMPKFLNKDVKIDVSEQEQLADYAQTVAVLSKMDPDHELMGPNERAALEALYKHFLAKTHKGATEENGLRENKQQGQVEQGGEGRAIEEQGIGEQEVMETLENEDYHHIQEDSDLQDETLQTYPKHPPEQSHNEANISQAVAIAVVVDSSKQRHREMLNDMEITQSPPDDTIRETSPARDECEESSSESEDDFSPPWREKDSHRYQRRRPWREEDSHRYQRRRRAPVGLFLRRPTQLN